MGVNVPTAQEFDELQSRVAALESQQPGGGSNSAVMTTIIAGVIALTWLIVQPSSVLAEESKKPLPICKFGLWPVGTSCRIKPSLNNVVCTRISTDYKAGQGLGAWRCCSGNGKRWINTKRRSDGYKRCHLI